MERTLNHGSGTDSRLVDSISNGVDVTKYSNSVKYFLLAWTVGLILFTAIAVNDYGMGCIARRGL